MEPTRRQLGPKYSCRGRSPSIGDGADAQAGKRQAARISFPSSADSVLVLVVSTRCKRAIRKSGTTEGFVFVEVAKNVPIRAQEKTAFFFLLLDSIVRTVSRTGCLNSCFLFLNPIKYMRHWSTFFHHPELDSPTSITRTGFPARTRAERLCQGGSSCS